MAEGKEKTGARKARAGREKKQKTAIIFQGGASRGAHQVGAMRYLEEMGIKPDIMIGSSIGVINSCLYATGGIERMETFWTSFKTHPFLPGVSLRENIFLGNSFLSMKKAFKRIESFLDFEEIFRHRIEVSFILSNLTRGTGELRSNRTEKTAEDMRAISRIGYTIPGLYPPVRYQGDYWCDGGFVWNVPFEHAIRRGATRIFMLLCIGRSLPEQRKFNNIYQVLMRFYDVMWVHTGSGGILHRDFTDAMHQGIEVHIIEPTSYLEGFGMLSLMRFHPSKARRYIKQGYRDAREQLGKLK